MRRSFRTRVSFSGWIPRVCTLGWYAMPRWGMGSGTWLGDWLQRSRSDTSGRDAPLGHGRGNVVAELAPTEPHQPDGTLCPLQAGIVRRRIYRASGFGS